MAARGLGKGLDSLIPKAISEPSKQEKEEKKAETMVKITMVEPNGGQPRKNFDEDSLMELAESIKQFGLLQPILVQDKKGHYEIIAGERRWRAAKIAGDSSPRPTPRWSIPFSPSARGGAAAPTTSVCSSRRSGARGAPLRSQ